jgi:hypothetical protein
VEQIYPSSGTVPENHLRFYVVFSAPVSRGEARQHVHLLDAKGVKVGLPIPEGDQELWDSESRRLTLSFDPHSTPHPVLVAGHSYTLVIDREWKDAGGAPLREPFRKQFRVGPSDHEPPDVAKWLVRTPAPYTTSSVIVGFPEPLDWASLQNNIEVWSASGPVPGTVLIEQGEQQWQFFPFNSWLPGEYRVVVNMALEDLAGNKIARAVDVDLDQPGQAREAAEGEKASLRFRVGRP